MASESDIVFSLVHGRYHDGWCWSFVEQELARLGFQSLSHTLPIEDEGINLNRHAALVANAERELGAERIVRVGHSWGADVVLRAGGIQPPERYIFIAGAFHTDTRRDLLDQRHSRVAGTVHTVLYESLQRIVSLGPPEHSLESVKAMASDTFYNDVYDPKLVQLALGHLRTHPRRKVEPPLNRPTADAPMTYVYTTKDMAIPKTEQAKFAESLGIPTVEFESGHTPMLSQPHRLAKQLIRIAAPELAESLVG